eukprot:jgi/Phyca11/13304/fgenesh1_pg.PHYCAscaffold_3_\
MVRVLYTEEEVLRREQDEKRLQDAQDALLPQIRAFLETPEEQEKEEKMKKKMEKNEKVGKKVETLAELKARVAKKEKVEFAQARVREDIEELEKGKTRLGQGHAAFRHEVEQVLLEKVGATVRQYLVRQQRDKAIAMGWRRPWDGVGGRAFERYQRLILRDKLGGVSEEGAATDTKDNTPEPDEDEEDVESDNNSEISDVSFDGYEDLVANLGREPLEESDEEDEESAAIAEAARAAALAALEAEEAERDVDDLDDTSEDEKLRESEDSDL